MQQITGIENIKQIIHISNENNGAFAFRESNIYVFQILQSIRNTFGKNLCSNFYFHFLGMEVHMVFGEFRTQK